MTAWTCSPIRLQASLTAAGLAAATAVAAAFLAPVLGPAAAAGAALVVAIAAGAGVWLGLAPLARLTAAADEVVDGRRVAAAFPDGPGELTAFTAAIRDIDARRTELAAAYESDLEAAAAALATFRDAKAVPTTPALVGLFAEPAERFRSAFDAAGRELTAARLRSASALRILNGLPDAVIVTDAAGAVRFLNPVAERLFGLSVAAAQKKPFAALVGDAMAPESTGDDPDRVVAGAAEVTDWVRAGANGAIVIRAAGETLVELTGSAPANAARDSIVCLVGRDLADGRVREAEDRAAVRANAARRFLDRYLYDTADALPQISAQLRLLTGDAKHTGHRDAMLLKLAAAGLGLKRMETFHTLAHWFRAVVWSDLPAPTPSEFMAVEVANLVADRLAGRFKARGNTLKLIDQGGWLFADSDRLEAALTGVLAHACEATTNSQVEVRITRLPAGVDRPTPATEFHVPDAGPALTAEMLAVVGRPFGGLAPAPLDRFEGIGGSPLGLVVAGRLAAALDGDLRIDSDASGQLGLRLTVPTRLAADGPPATVATAAPGALDVALFEEMVIGWRLGAPIA